ncbi:hypothetical protein QYF36_014179 [Acer negundo]|nr:hypothetical protein QYF36_014179 [Acer negundo]
MVTSSKPTDNLDELFDAEKEVSIEISPLDQRKRRCEEGDTVGSSIPTQCRWSTRNPRIGSGFNNKFDNSVDIVDEEAEGDYDEDDEEGIPSGIPVRKVLTLPVEYRVVPDSVCTMDVLSRLRTEYQIPDAITLTLPHRGFLLFWKEQCKMDGVTRESGFDEIRYIFQVATVKLGPRGQFYLRAKKPLKLIVPRATLKYPRSWREKWVVVEGDWGYSIHIGGTKHRVPTQFSRQDKWGKGKITTESWDILAKILARFYVNVKYPTSDPSMDHG